MLGLLGRLSEAVGKDLLWYRCDLVEILPLAVRMDACFEHHQRVMYLYGYLVTFTVVRMGYQMYHLQTPNFECFTFENVVNVVAFSFIQVSLWLPLKMIWFCKVVFLLT